jgi:hypothetical protein
MMVSLKCVVSADEAEVDAVAAASLEDVAVVDVTATAAEAEDATAREVVEVGVEVAVSAARARARSCLRAPSRCRLCPKTTDLVQGILRGWSLPMALLGA